MRLSIIGLLGTGLVGVAVGCGSEPLDGGSESAGSAAAGKAHAGSGGKGSTSKGGGSATGGSAGTKGGSAGQNTTGGTHATGGSGATGGTHATGGSGATGGTHATGGSGASVGGSSSVGGTSGTHGVDAGAGGQSAEGGAAGVEAGAGASTGGAAGEAAGNGGEPNAGGAAGAPSCPGGIECGSACIDPETRTLDQLTLDMPGSIGLSQTQRPGESFTVGAAGLLTGIEVAVGPCNDADVSGDIQLELFDGQGTSLGHVTLPQSSLPDTCGGTQLVEPTTGAGYFDLTPLCVSGRVGDVFTFILSLTGNAPATCDHGSWQCSNNGNYCEDDSDCAGFFYVGVTNCGGTGCDGAPSSYPGGSVVMQNVNSGVLQPTPAFELAFKTFVQ